MLPCHRRAPILAADIEYSPLCSTIIFLRAIVPRRQQSTNVTRDGREMLVRARESLLDPRQEVDRCVTLFNGATKQKRRLPSHVVASQCTKCKQVAWVSRPEVAEDACGSS